MKKILFVMYDYYPFQSANTSCMESYIEILKRNGYVVHILTRKMDDTDTPFQNGVFRVNDIYSIQMKKLSYMLDSSITNRIIKVINKYFINLCKISLYLCNLIFVKVNKLSWVDKAIVRKIVEIHKTNEYDAVITVSLPFACQLSGAKALEIVDKKYKFIPFVLDPFTYNYTLGNNKRRKNKRLKLESYTLGKSSIILTTKEIYKENYNNDLRKYNDKTYPMYYSNLKPLYYDKSKAEEFVKDKEYIECLFTGGLYSDIRNPKFMLDFLNSIKDIKLRLHIYTGWNDNILKYYKEVLGNKLVLHGYKDKNTIYNAMENCNILINIGNSISNQMPSKIFEYMSTGKPIVNFYSIDNDPTLEYLNKYKLKINIKQGKVNYQKKIEEFTDFCKYNFNKTMDFEEATINMKDNIAENVTKRFIDIIENTLEVN